MQNSQNNDMRSTNRRSFLRKGALGAGAIGGISFLSQYAAGSSGENNAPLNKGDLAIVTFLSALEQVEADLWIQYAELGGATNQGLSPIDLQLNGQTIQTGLSAGYVAALEVLDGDMPQYIADNTDDEISHHRFLNNYLVSKGASPVDLSRFAVLPPARSPVSRKMAGLPISSSSQSIPPGGRATAAQRQIRISAVPSRTPSQTWQKRLIPQFLSRTLTQF